MKHTAPTKISGISQTGTSVNPLHLLQKAVSIRVPLNSYLVAVFLGTFFSALAIYLEWNSLGYLLLGFFALFIPITALTDRLLFDGKRVYRTGILPKIWAYINKSRISLKISSVEQVETQATRMLKRGGKVHYRYKTTIRGKSVSFNFASGGEDYRNMIRTIFPMISENILDNRSIELRDYISEPKQTLINASLENIPPADVLENSFRELQIKSRRENVSDAGNDGRSIEERVLGLRRLANELRLSGSLLQSLETFRRAALLKPADAWLLFDFARCLQSFAGSERNGKLERKAVAMMRLSEKRAGNDGDLLVRLGENYFQIGEWQRAGIVFQKAVEAVGETFRSVKGLAEIALREGKIAHVIHNFSHANRLAETPALRRWSKGEVEYFSRLNENDEYMEMEVSRVNLLDLLEGWKKNTLRIAFIGFPLIALGVIFEDNLLANAGWMVSSVSLMIWTAMILIGKMLSPRIPIELLEED
ncbi:MAG: hypothetical protein H0V90_02515 [Blastocatellia bacterium]|nr:hypothetical protein [Blastocatellia bacterium]